MDSAIYGGKVGKNLAQNMTAAVVDAGASQVAHKIGDEKHSGALNPVTHKAAHGALAVAGAKLTGRDPVGAAIGSVVGETAAEMKAQSAGDRALEKTMQTACSADHKLSKAEFDVLFKENLDAEMHRCVLTGQLVGASAAFLAGRDVGSAYQTAKNATENNFALTTALAVGTGATLVAANVYDYYQAYAEGGWNAVRAKWDEERALDTSLATAGAGVGMSLGPVGSAVGATGGAIVGNASLRAKSIVQRLMKSGVKKIAVKPQQLEFGFAKDFKKGAKVSSEATEVAKKSSVKPGRVGAQKRLREIKDDPSVSSAWRGWLKQEENAMHKKVTKPGTSKRKILRNPPGTELAHPRGMEAAKGYDYSHTHLELSGNHAIQHKHDDFGRKNKDRGQK